MSIALAKLLATVSGGQQQQQQQQDVGPSTSAATAAAATTQQLPPELASAIPEHIKAVVPVAKLVAQCAYFKIPPWVAIPTVALHLECQRDGTRMAPLALDRYPTYLIGSGAVCDFQLEHPSTSRVHCALAYHGEKQCFVVVDLQSTNGTRVDGKRIEPSKPVALPIGSVLQVGHSLRRYIMRRGLASKEAVGDPATGGAVVEAPAAAATSTVPSGATEPISSSEPTRAKRPREDGGGGVESVAPVDAVAVPSSNDAVTAPVAAAQVAAAATPSPPAADLVVAEEADRCPRLLRHILFKHKDTRNPKSGNPANKGEAITRTQGEALALAKAIGSLYRNPPPLGDTTSGIVGGRGCWTEERFVEAAGQYSECATSKKGGLLGVVRRGDFAADFETHAFGLRDVGTVSAPFLTELGVHLVLFCRRCPEEEAAQPPLK